MSAHVTSQLYQIPSNANLISSLPLLSTVIHCYFRCWCYHWYCYKKRASRGGSFWQKSRKPLSLCNKGAAQNVTGIVTGRICYKKCQYSGMENNSIDRVSVTSAIILYLPIAQNSLRTLVTESNPLLIRPSAIHPAGQADIPDRRYAKADTIPIWQYKVK